MTALQKVIKVFRMKRKTKVLLGLVIFLLLILAALAVIYFVAFERFVLVSDPAWSYLLPSSELHSMRFELAKNGYRLVIYNASASNLESASSFTPILLSFDCSAILLGPLASNCAVLFEIDVSSMFENAVVYGMWSHECNNFDVTLVSDINSGWQAAVLQTTAQNAAVVYDSEGLNAYEAIKSALPKNTFIGYYDDGQSRLFAKNTISDMNEKQVVLALCPHLNNLYDLISLDNSLSWIVDYRYTKIVPKKQLLGIVLPDLTGFVKNTVGRELSIKGENHTVATLNYKYKAQ